MKSFILLTICFLFYLNSIAQIGWEKHILTNNHSHSHSSVIELSDKSYFISSTISDTNNFTKGSVVHLDELGNTLTQYLFVDSSIYLKELLILQTTKKNYNSTIQWGTSYYFDSTLFGIKSNVICYDGINQVVVDTSSQFVQCINENNYYNLLSIGGLGINLFTLDTFLYVLTKQSIPNLPAMFGKRINAFAIDAQKNRYIVGDGGYTTFRDRWITKVDSQGNVIFINVYNSIPSGTFEDVIISADNNLILVGYEYINPDYYACITKIDTNGNIIWKKKYNIGNNQQLFTIQHTKDGNYICGGYEYINNAKIKIYKFDRNGDTIWTKILGQNLPAGQMLDNIIPTNDGGYIISGTIWPLGYGNCDGELYVIKLDSLGNQNFATSINHIETDKLNISIYPNPASDFITVKSDLSSNITNVEIIDISGNIINSKSSNFHKIDVHNLPIGTYLLKIDFGKNSVIKKFSKM